MKKILDTYFLDAQHALKTAKEQNYFDNNRKLQLCYYDGEEVENPPKNLIHLPFNKLQEELIYLETRIPQEINIDMLNLSEKVENEIKTSFNLLIQEVKDHRDYLVNNEYVPKIKYKKLNFNENLRVYIGGNSSTVVMKFISECIAKELKKLGYIVHFHTNDECKDFLLFHIIKEIHDFNPHITININHLGNEYINDDTFNFVWFQDGMESITDTGKLYLREKDYFFHLIESLNTMLKKKDITSTYQPFCIDSEIYKNRDDIKKEKKIVFIGSSYKHHILQYENDKDFNKIFKEAKNLFEEKNILRDLRHKDSEIKYLMNKYNKDFNYISSIYAFLMRDYCIEKLCSIDTNFKIEIYGYGFEYNKIIKPYYKGPITNGEEISKIYNSATYGYCPGGYILMQRTLECAFSETIPLVLDVREDTQDYNYDKRVENTIEFFNIKTLEDKLKEKVPNNKTFDFIKKEYSYKNFINKCLKIVEDNK